MNVFFSCRLGKRALLLQQMEAHYEQQKAKKKQQSLMSQAATERNAQILKVALLCAFCYTCTRCFTEIYHSTVKRLFYFIHYSQVNRILFNDCNSVF